MSEALNKAYASNTETPIITVEISHSAVTDQRILLVQGFYDLDATLETGESVTFSKSAIDTSLPSRSTDGSQSINIQIDNASNQVYSEIKKVIDANRISAEPVKCTVRLFLESDLSEPKGTIYRYSMSETSINRTTATLTATYAKISDTRYPRNRYYPTKYPTLKYV